MKLFLTYSILLLLLLLVPLVLSNVIARSTEKKIKLIYDEGYYRSETSGRGFYWFYTSPNWNFGGEAYGNGTREMNFEPGKDARGRDIALKLFHNSETPTLDDLSFVVESLPTDAEKCDLTDLTPAFKKLIANCKGSIRVRELTSEEKSKARNRRQLLAASLEAKKQELKGIPTNESGEFRLLVDDVEKLVIAESIGISNYVLLKDYANSGTYIHIANQRGDDGTHHRKQMGVIKSTQGSFGVENILSANTEKTCNQTPLKKWMNDCILAELRPLTEQEKSELNELNGVAFGLLNGLI